MSECKWQARAWKGPSSPLESCAALFVWPSLCEGLWCDPPREFPHRWVSWASCSSLLPTIPIQKEPFCPNSSICLCILPGFKLHFCRLPLGHKALRGQVVCLSSSSYFPKWCDFSTKSTVLETETVSVQKRLCCMCVTGYGQLTWIPSLVSTPLKGVIMKTNLWGLLWGVNIQ